MSGAEKTNYSEAIVETDRPARYGKQLVAHLGRRVSAEWDEAAGRARLQFRSGFGELLATERGLELRVEGAAGELPTLEDVVGRHLVRFGQREELVVRWTRSDGTAGSVQRSQVGPAAEGARRGEGEPESDA